MTRKGKIARLPETVRNEVNRKLEDGLLAKEILAWLNGLPEVQEILARQFEGNPISEVNLTHWRKGGFADWRARRDGEFDIAALRLKIDDVKQGGAPNLPEDISTLLSIGMAKECAKLHTMPGRDHFERLHELVKSHYHLTRAGLASKQTRLEHQKLYDLINAAGPFSCEEQKRIREILNAGTSERRGGLQTS
jgi:hypothetical protein